MTTSTFGMSRPLAATSVVRRIEGEDGEGTADAFSSIESRYS